MHLPGEADSALSSSHGTEAMSVTAQHQVLCTEKTRNEVRLEQKKKPWRFVTYLVTSISLHLACEVHPDGPLPPSLRTSPPRRPLLNTAITSRPTLTLHLPFAKAAPTLKRGHYFLSSPPLADGWFFSNALSRERIPGSRLCSLPDSATHPSWSPIKRSAHVTFTT